MRRASQSAPTRSRRFCLIALTVIGTLGAALLPGTAMARSEVETPPPVSGRRLSDPESILPADVLARVEVLRANVELLRLYMGRRVSPDPLMRVESARPREVYSQAANLERRANRLAFEQVRIVRNESIPITREAKPADVFSVVDSAFAAVLLVKQDLGIETAVAEVLRPESTAPSDVFNATIAAGTEIDHLLELRTSSSDVFQLVTSAVHIAAALHSTIPGGPNLPEEPAFEANRMPSDVLARMRRCFELISRIGESKGVYSLEFEISDEVASQVSRSDVSDMASLLVEELVGLHRRYPDAEAPQRAYYPGRRFPSQVFQRVGLLELILKDLAKSFAADLPAAKANR